MSKKREIQIKNFEKLLINELNLNEEEIKVVLSNFKLIKVKKKDNILEIGNREHNLYFLLDGLVQMFFIDEEVGEVTLRFFKKNDFFTFFPSFVFDEPSTCGLSALTDSEIACISKNDLFQLFSQFPFIEKFYNTMCYQYFINQSKTQHKYHVLSAKQKYLLFIESNKDIIDKIPIKNISSFLGIHTNSLSRIRKELKL